MACHQGHFEIVKLLIDKGADIHKFGRVSIMNQSFLSCYLDLSKLIYIFIYFFNSIEYYYRMIALHFTSLVMLEILKSLNFL